MKQVAKAIIGAVLIAFIYPCVSGDADAKVLPETAKLIPPETILLVDIDDFSVLQTQFEKTNLYKLYKDPAMAALVEDFKAKRQEKIRKVDNKLVRAIVTVDVLPQGRAAFAVVLDEQTRDANEPPFLFITQWGENTTRIKEAVDKMVEEAIEDGANRKIEDYRGVSITTIMRKPPKALSHCFIDDCLMASTDLEVLRFVIAHLHAATSPTLSDEADYSTTMKAVGPYHDVDLYVNAKQVIRTELAKDATGETKAMLANLGLENVTSLGGAISLGRDPGGSSSGKVSLKINGPKKGIFNMFDIESAALRAPPFIPASAYSVTIINLNIKKAYDALYNMLYSFSPQYAALMHVPLLPQSPQGEPGLQLKADIITHLGSQIVVARNASKPVSATSTPAETLVAVGVDNHNALEKSLSLWHSKVIAGNNPDARRELLGRTIYLVDLSAMVPVVKPPERTPMRAPSEICLGGQPPLRGCDFQRRQEPAKQPVPQMPKLAFTVTDSHLLLGSESTIERIIRAMSSTDNVPVASTRWFTIAKSAIPSMVGLAGLEDNATAGELLWQMLKKGSKSTESKDKDSEVQIGIGISSESPFPQLLFSQAGSSLFDFSLLPEFDAVRKYFGLSAYYGISRPDGFFFEFKYLNPAGKVDDGSR